LGGEGAAVYDSSLGLKRYRRRLTMKEIGKIEVNHVVEGTSPHIFTEVLHSDAKINPIAEQKYQTSISDVALHIQLLSPLGPASKIEQNVVMGPGKPGSVDKGSLEPRGERLLISTGERVANAHFVWELDF
jgi:hypothetical protein